MGRAREFEETHAIAAAAEVFRERGYVGASVDHLVTATGVHRGSLYGAFGSKHGLFLQVLQSLHEREGLALSVADPELRMDLLLIALVELAPTDSRVRDRVEAILAESGIGADELGRRLIARARIAEDRS